MINPIIRREAKTSLRSWKAFAAVGAYVLVLALFMGIGLWQTMYNSYRASFAPEQAVYIFILLMAVQSVFVLAVTPVLTGGSINGERERQTLDLMLVSKMSTLSIVVGKFLSGLAIIALMIVASMPIYAILIHFGGTTAAGILVNTIYMLIMCAAFGAVAIFFSTIFRKNVTAIIFTYVIIAFLVLGLLVIEILAEGAYHTYFGTPLPHVFKILLSGFNPAMGMLDLISIQSGIDIMGIATYFYVGRIPLFVFNIIILLGITVLFIIFASLNLKRISKKG